MRLFEKARAVRRTLPAALVLAATLPAYADVAMPAIFGDHMVLQQQQTIPVWGTADPGEKITVALGDSSRKTVANEQGRWRVDLPAQKPSDAATTLTVTGKNTVTFTDVLLGEVWVASGQSNMEFGVRNVHDSAAVLAAADRPMIRLFSVPHATPLEPQTSFAATPAADLNGHWVVCTAESIRKTGNGSSFSAVAYFFRARSAGIHASAGGDD